MAWPSPVTVGQPATANQYNALVTAVQTWGGNVNAGGYGLTNLAVLTVTDPAGITFGSNWETWSPSVTPAGSMTVSSVVSNGTYLRIGPVCFFSIAATFTLGGTAAQYIQFGVPPAMVLMGSITVSLSVLLSMAGQPYQVGGAYISPGAANLITMFNSGTTNLTLGAANIVITGSYRCA